MSNTFALCSSISSLILLTYSYTHSLSLWSPKSSTIVVIIVFFIVVLKLSTYSLFLSRLKSVFNNSALEISNRLMIISILLLIGFAIAYFVVIFEYILLEVQTDVNPKIYWKGLLVAHIVEVVIDFITQILLLILFNGCLFRLMRYMKQSVCDDIQMDGQTDKSTYFLNDRQQNVMYIVTRTTILVTTSNIATTMHGLMFVILALYFFENESALLVVRTLQPIYCSIEGLCVFMNFKYNDKIYSRLCCGCKKCCYWCCKKINWWFEERNSNKHEINIQNDIRMK